MADPWAKFIDKEPEKAGGDPWARFGVAPTEPEQKAAPQKANTPSAAADVAKGAGAGVAKGIIGMAGLVPDIAGLARTGANKLFDQFMPPRMEGPRPPDLGEYAGSRGIQRGVEAVTGKFYEPQTTAGQYARTIGEFMPGAALMPGSAAARIGTSALAGAGSETGGQLAKGSAVEPYARLAGALAGGMLPSVASRAVTPLPMPAERKALVDVLQREGVPLTAGQATGSKPLRWMESVLGDLPGAGGRPATIQADQAKAFTQAALRRVGSNADDAGPDALREVASRVGGSFDDIAARADVKMDPQFANQMRPLITNYIENSVMGTRPPLPDIIAKQLTEYSQNLGGKITGKQFQELRKRVSEGLKTADGPYKEFLSGVRNSLDGLVERTAAPGVAKEWQEARRQYANYKTIEKAMGGAGEATAMGMLSPQQLRTAVKGSHSGAYTRGTSDLSELARAGAGVLQPLPNSGTGPRNFFTGVAAGAGALTRDPASVLAPLLVPPIAGRALMSKPVQKYLANQKMAKPDNEAIERLIMALRPDLINAASVPAPRQ